MKNLERIKNNRLIENLFGSRARVKILKHLALNNELNITSIIKKTKLNHNSVQRHLEYLKDVDLVQQKNFGRIRIYRFKEENMKARSIKNLINIWEER
ncbi:MAG: ArsR family transcriptional regulator [Candidatus Lokiarchaeota archaeon]|nr:ArsR family transcriptional regulator [Candidatus Lokiarchaeota archaeon]